MVSVVCRLQGVQVRLREHAGVAPDVQRVTWDPEMPVSGFAARRRQVLLVILLYDVVCFALHLWCLLSSVVFRGMNER